MEGFLLLSVGSNDLLLLTRPFLNMVLGDVEEIVTSTEVDEETCEEIIKTSKRQIAMLFVRGDGVILISPPLRTS